MDHRRKPFSWSDRLPVNHGIANKNIKNIDIDFVNK